MLPFILSKKPDLNKKNKQGETPLTFAFKSIKPFWIVKTLIDHGADVNIQNNEGQTPLMLLVEQGLARYQYSEFFDVLLKHGAQLDLRDNNGNTALILSLKKILSISNESATIFEQLLKAGADMHIKNHRGDSVFELIEHSKDFLKTYPRGIVELVNKYKKSGSETKAEAAASFMPQDVSKELVELAGNLAALAMKA